MQLDFPRPLRRSHSKANPFSLTVYPCFRSNVYGLAFARLSPSLYVLLLLSARPLSHAATYQAVPQPLRQYTKQHKGNTKECVKLSTVTGLPTGD